MCLTLNVDEDSFSDWSTDSCGWSDEDCGVDLDFTTPPLSVDSGAVDTSDQEIVRCICEVEEENDFMIQVSFLPPAKFYYTLTWGDLFNSCSSVKTVCVGNTEPAWAC